MQSAFNPAEPELLRESPTELDGELDLASDIRAISETMRSEALQLQAAKELVNHLEGINSTLQAKPAPSDVMEAALKSLTILHENVERAIGSPGELPEPIKAGYPGEATLRARFGVKQLTDLYSTAVAEQLANCLSEVERARSAAEKVCESLKELHVGVTTYSAGISSAVKNMEAIQQKVQALADRTRSSSDSLDAATGPWKKALGLTAFAFEDLLKKLIGTQANLATLAEKVRGRISKIQEFVDGAQEDVRAAFQVPAPACFCQSLTIGKDPRMMRTMLEQLEAISKMPLDKVTDVLGMVTQEMNMLRLERARVAVNNFAACAGGQLNALDVLLARARSAEPPGGNQQGVYRNAPEVSPVQHREFSDPVADDR